MVCIPCLWDQRAGRIVRCTAYPVPLNLCDACGTFADWSHIARDHPTDLAHLVGPSGRVPQHA
jgi:hypothetical protein